MNRKRILAVLLLAAAMISVFSACGRKKAENPAGSPATETAAVETASSEPASQEMRPAETAEPVLVQPASLDPATAEPSEEAAPAVTAEPTPEPTAEPTPVPTAKPVPQPVYDIPAPEVEQGVRPGTYTGSDGSVLTVNIDGTCTYETEVSGKINGKAMSADLVFHGVVDAGVFTFDKVMYGALDLTALAAAAGYTDASPWEAAAAIIYGG